MPKTTKREREADTTPTLWSVQHVLTLSHLLLRVPGDIPPGPDGKILVPLDRVELVFNPGLNHRA